MKFCAKCGAQMPDEMKSCAACGWTVPSVIEQEIAAEETEQLQEPVIRPKKKKSWPWVALCLTLVILGAAAVWFFFPRDDAPEQETVKQQEIFVLNDAIDDSRTQLKGLFSKKENLQAFIDTLCDRLEEKEMSLAVETELEESSVKVDMAVQLNYSEGASVLDGNMDLGIQYGENEADFELKFALQDDSLQLTVPGLIDEVLEAEFSDSIQDGLSLDKVETLKGSVSKVLIEQLIDQLIESIEAGEETQETIVFGEEERECTLYTITYDQEIADELMQALGAEESTEKEETNTLQVIVYEKQVVGLIGRSGQGETAETNKLLLCGTENPWADVRIYNNDEEVENIVIAQTENGFEVIITNISDATEMRFVCDDQAQTFTIESREDGVIMVLYYRVDGEEITLRAEEQGQEPISMKLLPLERAPESLSDNAINIEEMTQTQSSLLLLSALQKLKDDPQTTWIYDLFVDSVAT